MLRIVLKGLSLGAALVNALPTAAGAGPPIRADIQQALATAEISDDPDVAIYRLNLDVLLTNRSEKPINVPTGANDTSETTRIAVIGVQSRRQDGPWTTVNQSSWYGTGSEKYDSCTSIPPAGTAALRGLPSGLVLLKKQLAALGSEPTMRFSLIIFCRQADGKVLTTFVPTEAFTLRLPAQPR